MSIGRCCVGLSLTYSTGVCLIILALATKTSFAPYTYRTFLIVKILPTKSIRKNVVIISATTTTTTSTKRRAATVKIRSFVNERERKGALKKNKARQAIKSTHEESADTNYIKMTLNMWMRHSLHMQLGAYIYNFNAILYRNVRRFVKSFGVSNLCRIFQMHILGTAAVDCLTVMHLNLCNEKSARIIPYMLAIIRIYMVYTILTSSAVLYGLPQRIYVWVAIAAAAIPKHRRCAVLCLIKYKFNTRLEYTI